MRKWRSSSCRGRAAAAGGSVDRGSGRRSRASLSSSGPRAWRPAWASSTTSTASLARAARGAGEEPGGDRQVRPLPPERPAAAGARGAGTREGPESQRVPGRVGIRQRVRDAVVRTLDSLKLDALVYPTWSNVPRLIGDLNTRTATTASSSRRPPDFRRSRLPMATRAAARCPRASACSGAPGRKPTLIRLPMRSSARRPTPLAQRDPPLR